MKPIEFTDLPVGIKTLIEERRRQRAAGNYGEADKGRKSIEKAGYSINDTPSGEEIYIEGEEEPANSFLVLIGSGEISPWGRKIHERVFEQIGKKTINIAILSTPAGFQPNVDKVYKEVADFFQIHLKNFHPKIDIIFANNHDQANDENIIKPIYDADYIFTGAGSPTYAAKNLMSTQLLAAIEEKVKNGASLCLASAAIVAFSRFCLPVYEIYKVGADLHWNQGLDIYSKFVGQMTVIPHFNNTEGGEKTDTSRCFVGKERFEKLLKLLPQSEKVIGIDETTGLIINLKTKEKTVLGKGEIHEIT